MTELEVDLNNTRQKLDATARKLLACASENRELNRKIESMAQEITKLKSILEDCADALCLRCKHYMREDAACDDCMLNKIRAGDYSDLTAN